MKQSRLYKEILKIGIDNCLFLLNNNPSAFCIISLNPKLGGETKITLKAVDGTAQPIVMFLKKLEEGLMNEQGEFLIKRNCLKSYELKK